MKYTLRIPLLFLILCSIRSYGQEYTGGFQLEIKPEVALKNGWKLQTKLSSRTYFFEGGKGDGFQWHTDYNRTELELVGVKKIGSIQSLGFGYLLRNQDGSNRHRLIQQFSTSSKAGSLTLGHRFRTDQTFQKSKDVLYRIRYRASFKKPFKAGNSQKESYWFIRNEYLGNLQGGKGSMEIRAFPGVGFALTPKHALEIGLDYRLENLFGPPTKQVFLMGVAWIPSF